MTTQEQYIEHEVKLRLLEEKNKTLDKIFTNIDQRFEKIDKRFEQIDVKFDNVAKRFDMMDAKIDNNFKWTVGLIFMSIIMPIFLHAFKLV